METMPLLTEPSYWPLVWHYKISSEKETLLGTRRAIDVELEGKQIQKQAINIEPESLLNKRQQ